MSNDSASQNKILTWWYQNYKDSVMKRSEIFENFSEDKDYDGNQNTFDKFIERLFDSNLLDKPGYGRYRLNEKGENKAEFILEGGRPDEEPETLKEKKAELTGILHEKLDSFRHNSNRLEIRVSEIDSQSMELIDWFEEEPEKFMEVLDEAVEKVSPVGSKFDYRLQVDVEYWSEEIFKAGSQENLGGLVTLEGTIESASEAYLELTKAQFECVQCTDEYEKDQNSKKLKSPYKCDCGSKKFETISKTHRNVIEFRISDEKGQNEKIKATFRSDGISDRANRAFKPGNNIRITGIVKSQKDGSGGKIKPFIDVISFNQANKTIDIDEISDELKETVKERVGDLDNPLNAFASSLAPHIVGQEEAKRVFAASLIGGSPRKLPSGEVVDDGRIHSLILSNPGTGKSEIQKFISNTFPRGLISDGKNATGVALTATVEQIDGEYQLRAGKLVLADKGILCLDEFDKMDKEDAARLNTAMTSETFPIDKASINAELPGQATIIATGNFEEYVEDQEVALDKMPNHAESLMDRFSLTYAMRNPGDSGEVFDTILGGSSEVDSGVEDEAVFSKEELVVYRELARNCEPVLTEEAHEMLKEYLQGVREIAGMKGNGLVKSTSSRQMESLRKITTCFARARFSEKAEKEDVEKAVRLMQRCRSSRGLDMGDSSESEEVLA